MSRGQSAGSGAVVAGLQDRESQEDSIALSLSAADRVPARVLGKASSFVFSFRITITTLSPHLLSIKNILYNDKPLKMKGGVKAGRWGHRVSKGGC